MPGAQPHLLIVGAGMAGLRLAQSLAALAAPWQITLLGAEPRPTYNRIMLSPVLAGEKTFDDIVMADAAWYRARNIRFRPGVVARAIDPVQNHVITANGEIVPYDALVLATGSNPILLPLPGRDLPGVLTFRDMGDVDRMADLALPGRPAIVIGGGLLGLEAAAGLRRRGADVTVIHLLDTLMERQLDTAASIMLRQSLEQRGIRFVMPAVTDCILGEHQVAGIRLKSGHILPADLVVMAVGIRPNIELAKSAGLDCGLGVRVNDRMQSSIGNIHAIGECAEHDGHVYGLVAPLYEQADILARHLAGEPAAYAGSQIATSLKISGVDLYSAGDFADGPGKDNVLYRDADAGIYKKLVLQNGRLCGAVLYGDVRDGPFYFDLIRSRRAIGGAREMLIFGQAFAPDLAAGEAAAEAPLEPVA